MLLTEFYCDTQFDISNYAAVNNINNFLTPKCFCVCNILCSEGGGVLTSNLKHGKDNSAKVSSEVKSVPRLKIFFRNWPHVG